MKKCNNHHIKNYIFIVICILQLHSFTTTGAENIISAGEDFQISIPSDWIIIPNDNLKQMEMLTLENTGQYVRLDYGYCPNHTDAWNELPYAVIRVNRSGKIQESQLQDSHNMTNELARGAKKADISAGVHISNISTRETKYDDNTKIIWAKNSMNIEDVGKVQAIQSFKLTEFGYVHFMGYTLDDDLETYEPIFENMIKSIKFKDGDIYKTHNRNINKTRKIIERAAIVTILSIAIIVSILHYYNINQTRKSN